MNVEQKAHPPGEQGVRASLDAVAKRVAEGGVNPAVRRWSIEMLDDARKRGANVHTPRNRAEVLLKAVQQKLWVPDPVGAEFIQSAALTACTDPNKPCFKGGDCFAEGTLLLVEGHELRSIENIKVGDKIWGLDAWTEVKAIKYKGVLPIDVVTLNNGAQLRLTTDHHVYVMKCRKHEERCPCGPEDREELRVSISDLHEGDVLVSPKRLPFGVGNGDAELAYLEGLYVSDGWSDQNSRFCISGQDGCPKEEQKREVERICAARGIHTRWHRKYIAVNDEELTLHMQQLGGHAPEKHVASLNLDEAPAAALLRGVMADSGKNTRGEGRTFTTTSRELAVQMRVLHKMFGISCGWSFIENHGGLGKNPIYRLGTRPTGGWQLRVRSIEREVLSVPCWDIQTSDHRVYLPEHDVTVSNCDDLVTLLGAAFLSVGIDALVVGHGYSSRGISHVLTAAHVNGKWHYADPSSYGPQGAHFAFGDCAPFTRERLYSVPNIKVLCDDQRCIRGEHSYKPEAHGFVTEGVFVGVSGVPEFARRFRWLEK